MNTTTKKTVPEIGMGITYSINGDSYPHTVVEILSPRRIRVYADDYKVIKGNIFDGSAEYEITPKPYGPENVSQTKVLSLRKSGGYVPLGEADAFYNRYYLGYRRASYNPHV